MPSIINATTTNGLSTSADNSGSLQLATNNGTTAVTIDTSQNVGIGTTTVNNKFQVKLDSTNNIAFAPNGGNGARVVGVNDISSAYLPLYMDGSIVGVNISGTERMRITSGGNLLVGTTTSDGRISAENTGNVITAKQNGAGGWCYKSNAANNGGTRYQVEFLSDGNAAGSITSGASTTTYGTTSDYRLKENIAPMAGALDKVQELKPVTYTWVRDGADGQGFIAHELQEIVPDCVVGKKDAVDAEGNPVYQVVDTSFLVATLTAAIQELNAKVEQQAVRIAELEGAK